MELDPAAAFATFDRQDSGCVSYGIEASGRRWFVKTAATAAGQESLGRAIRFHRSVRHPAIVAPLEVVDTGTDRRLVYPWHDGIVLDHATVDGSDRSGLRRFRSLPVPEVLAAVDAIYDAHAVVVASGFVSVDLYDGCFLYDFDAKAMHLIDLDEYRPGPFVVDGPRLPGSTRYMAPEELAKGATIDERTTVFQLGRVAEQLLADPGRTPAQRRVIERATRTEAQERFPTVEAMAGAWRGAAGLGRGTTR